MIARVSFSKSWEFSRDFSPIKIAAFNNNATKSCAMAANKLRSRLNYNICTMLKRAEQVRSCKSVVNKNRKIVAMRNLGNSLKIRQISIRITKSFKVHELRIRLNCILEVLRILRIHKSSCYTISRKSMTKKVISSTIHIL